VHLDIYCLSAGIVRAGSIEAAHSLIPSCRPFPLY
jgi:hypothetical protein